MTDFPSPYAMTQAEGHERTKAVSKFEIAVRLYRTYLITEALQRTNGNRSQAARNLGLHRNTLARSIKVLGIKYEKQGPQRVHQPTPLAASALANQRRG